MNEAGIEAAAIEIGKGNGTRKCVVVVVFVVAEADEATEHDVAARARNSPPSLNSCRG